MTEHSFLLEEINPLDFFGVNNQRLNQLKRRFPAVKFIARGNELKLKGPSSRLATAKTTVEYLLTELDTRGSISDLRFEELLHSKSSSNGHSENADEDFVLHGSRGTVIRAQTAGQREILRAAKENDIVFALGPAGTGKTYMGVALAIKALKDKEVKKIFLVRPAVEAGETLGFLPGDLKEKVDPYLRPLYDALEDMVHHEKLKAYLEKNVIEIAPLAYMRGRTLKNAFVILDEAQNTTEMQFRMFLTRLGRGGKIFITGDDSQIDLPRNQRSGLLQAVRILEGVKGIGFVRMKPADVMRHKLVRKIIAAYQHEDDLKDRGRNRKVLLSQDLSEEE
ncbi:MAG TPA: PhoH family protein [Bacteroidetes bacterium]|nr:PhoH family protein [Bacteroidota bacterium]